jgi:drug/metabolite transporter (DMT)-like permease
VLSILFSFFSLKYFSPTIYRTTDSAQPLIVVMLGAIYLKEGISNFDVVALILAFTASFIIIQASDDQSQADANLSGSTLGFQIALIGLILNPFLLASGQIAMR